MQPNMYPDGVTGHEWQIAGPEALTVNRECAGLEAKVYPAHFIDELLTEGSEVTRELLPEAIKTEYECIFSGEVDAEIYDYELTWTCPVCGHENHEPWGWPQDEFDEPDDDPYPDDDYYGYDF